MDRLLHGGVPGAERGGLARLCGRGRDPRQPAGAGGHARGLPHQQPLRVSLLGDGLPPGVLAGVGAVYSPQRSQRTQRIYDWLLPVSAVSEYSAVNCRPSTEGWGVPESIEDIILGQDRRGVALLRPHLPRDFCGQAAQFVLDHPGVTIITTGFYILSGDSHETDGPPGALAIGSALHALGRRVVYASDGPTVPLLRDRIGAQSEVLDCPIADAAASRMWAQELLARLNPALLISIERCGRTSQDTYLNMRTRDISAHTARLDYLFEAGVPSVGIGDGGNEIGMGNLAEVIPTVESLPRQPAVTKVDRLVLASVSNWGGYGLVAALSRLVGRNLLPTVEHETELVRYLVDHGAVDGTTGQREYRVDGFTLEENGRALERLRGLVGQGPTH
ncbi:MAG: DUF4392 domain-containing protein [Dehalococcoidia bacterium]|nr:DUF4392 domain-containing protein [Dehalococcoidia bacterium]